MTAARINPDLAPLARPIADLKLDPNNARKHGERDLAVLAASLSEHGQQKAIVARPDGTVIAGNGTLQAALRLGWESIACVTYDGPDKDHARAFAIMDNRSAELSEWDFEVLSSTLKQLPDTLRAGVGFAEHELSPLLAAEWTPPEVAPLPTRPDGKHVVAFSDEEWAPVQALIERMSTERGEKVKPIVAIMEACRVSVLR